MEVPFTPELEKKLTDLAGLSGVPAAELVQEAVAGYVDHVAEVRATLDARYDDLKSGRIQPIDGEEVRRQMKARTQAQRDRRR
jgi:predicted DNA-binding protein